MFVDGFYNITGPQEATFYVTSDTPSQSVGYGWRGTFFIGIQGRVQITGVSRQPTETYKWAFTFQTDTDQAIQPSGTIKQAIINPPDKDDLTPVFGTYTSANNVVTFNFTTKPETTGYVMLGLPTFSGALALSPDSTLRPVGSGQVPDSKDPVTVRGYPTVLLRQKAGVGTFLKAHMIDINPNIVTGDTPYLRELNERTRLDDLFKVNPYTESRGRGFSSGSILSLLATGPQETYLLSDNPANSNFNSEFKRHTNFAIFQRINAFPLPNPTYQGQSVTVELKPTEMGDLLSNMYLIIKLPVGMYTPHVGRALMSKVELMANETVIETLYDDWYFIHDQLFLNADEISALYNAVDSNNVIIPLEFFFCRRKTKRMQRPYLPLCAMLNQKLYVRFTFNKNTWWSAPGSDPNLDFQSIQLVTEEILLENQERLYYQTVPQKFIVNKIVKDSVTTFNNANISVPLTVNYPVEMIAWFFRDKNFENDTDPRQYMNRYRYGYSTQYTYPTNNLVFPSGTLNYVDVVDTAKITLNNTDICSTFKGSLYYSFKQPIEHGLSIPSNGIYTYSFGLKPKEYNEGGFMNFAKLKSNMTLLTLNLLQQYKQQIYSDYNLYIFYYCVTLITFEGGFARVPLL